MTKLIFINGAPCLGKTSLCKKLLSVLPNSHHLCVDSYKEFLWDACGFKSAKEREDLARKAKGVFLIDLEESIGKYEYVLIDYSFRSTNDKEIKDLISKLPVVVKTVKLHCNDTEKHKKAWLDRFENGWHGGHCATKYENGVGSNYGKAFRQFADISTFGMVLPVEVDFEPYKLSESIGTIKNFILI